MTAATASALLRIAAWELCFGPGDPREWARVCRGLVARGARFEA